MKKKNPHARRFLLGTFVVLVLAGVVYAPPFLRDAYYVYQLGREDRDTREVAEEIVASGGRWAVASAVDAMIRGDEDEFRDWFKASKSKLTEGSAGSRLSAVLRPLGEALEFPDDRSFTAYSALSSLRHELAVASTFRAALVRSLKRPDWNREPNDEVHRVEPWRIVWGIGRLGRSAERSVDLVADLAGRGTETLRWSCVRTIGLIAPPTEKNLKILIRGLKDPSDRVARAAAGAIFGRERIDSAVPALIEALKRKDKALVRAAARALGRIGDAARPALALLDRDPPDIEMERRHLSSSSLMIDGSSSIQRTDEVSSGYEYAVLAAYCRLQPDDTELARALTRYYERSPGARLAILGEIERLGPKGATLAPVISPLLQLAASSTNGWRSPERAACVRSLRGMGPAITGFLLSKLQDPEESMVSGAIEVLGYLSTERDRIAPR
ncbi:MAG: HEAT repeat domain-containing protein, partial [Planctomycetota bacterium]